MTDIVGTSGRPEREAALAFVNGANRGWLASDLSAWAQRHLIGTGFLLLKRPQLGAYTVEETGAGRVSLPVVATVHPSRETTSSATRVVAVAYERVLQNVRGMLATPPDDRFLNAALYTGRVQRTRGGRGGNEWVATLDEGGSLSQWVLALFAVDVLRDREPYETTFTICDACGRTGFDGSRRSRTRCTAHDGAAPASRSTPRQITVPPPTVREKAADEADVNEDGDRITRPWAVRG